MRFLIAFISGALFGAGLLLSGMTDTQKVQGWLDIFGAWDPTLAFVMGGAILPMLVAWRMTKTRRPITGGTFPAPARPELDRGLILGSALFGAGWGLVGLCPGPAMAALSYGGTSSAIFLVAMAAGMRLAPGLRAQLDRAANAA